MKVGAFQFRASGSVPENLSALKRGIALAREAGVRLLLTQECGLTGYPPLEAASVSDIDPGQVSGALAELQALADGARMYVAVGLVLKEDGGVSNSLVVLVPGGQSLRYDKRALWGWDADNFLPGNRPGTFEADGLRIGLRICFEVRFPEYFRELWHAGCDLVLVAFRDGAEEPRPGRRDILRAHLMTRAMETVAPLVSANALAAHQTAPTCLIDPDGRVLEELPGDREGLLVHDLRPWTPNFGQRGRIEVARRLAAGEHGIPLSR